jgi:hypothetical protein
MSVFRICGAILFVVTGLSRGAVPEPPTDLRVNGADQPLGIDMPNPLFSWIVRDPGHD